MPYFACPENQSRQQQANALDPVVQLLLSKLAHDQNPSNKPQETQKPHSSAARRPSAAHSAASNNHHTFSPKFDVYETSEYYHLEGELPGLHDRKTIDIEFMSDRTLTIRGRIEKAKNSSTSTSSALPAHAEPGEPKELRRRSLKPTVEDTEDEDDYLSMVNATTEAKEKERKSNQTIEVSSEKTQIHAQETSYKVWLNERSYGNFQRSFSFPTPVDLDGVVAKLDAGLLMIQVPKVVFSGVRRIEID